MNSPRLPIFVITSHKKNAVWGEPFKYRHLAQRELDEQLAKLSPEQLAQSDWKIEVKWIWAKEDKKKEKPDTVAQDVLANW